VVKRIARFQADKAGVIKMAKKTPPIAGYWLCCYSGPYDKTAGILYSCGSFNHNNCRVSLYATDGTLKNMKYVHSSWGNGWYPLTWTCFPFKELKEGRLQHFNTLADLQASLGNHKFSQAVLKNQT